MNSLQFIKTALKDYKVGALTITSPTAVSQILDNLGNDVKCVIEYGAGDGVITREILKRIPEDGKVIAVELNKDFFQDLDGIKDPRLTVIYDDVISFSQRLSELGSTEIDVVISGIPFTFFNSDVRKGILARTHQTLRPGGRFIVYQYTILLKPLLDKYFSKVRIRCAFKNIPPYFIMVAEK